MKKLKYIFPLIIFTILIVFLFNIDFIFESISICERSKLIFIFLNIIMTILLILIIYLFFNLHKKKQMEFKMKAINDELLQTQEELQIMAYYDDIVDLPNRNMFFKIMEERFSKNFQNNISGSILYMDIDNFKNVNDIFGHSFGNMFLNEVAERLKSIKSINGIKDYIFRLSGDEFIIALEDKSKEETEQIAKEIQDSFKNPFKLLDEEIKVTTSMGIVFYPKDGNTVDEIFKKADLAMYKVKELGKNAYKIYEEKIEKEVTNKVLMENNLRSALEKDEFVLNYQPQIDPCSGKIVGFEALIRWNSLDHGLVSPIKFIPMAEEIGEINNIGEWVLKEACQFAVKVKEKYKKKIEVSVNISPVQLQKTGFIQMVKKILKETGMENCLLGIEVTETALMESFEENVKKLEKLKSMGIKIYLDDFGTGYSSLNYLLRLPINTIKIDKSFIDDMMIEEKGRSIIAEIINLAHDINLDVVAEGVEIQDQLSMLKELRCNTIQGYIYSKPLSEKNAYKFLNFNLNRDK